MLTNCAIKLVNDHLVITDKGQNILVDTGSPVSFRPSGSIGFGENEFAVHSSIPGVSTAYLSEKVGCDMFL